MGIWVLGYFLASAASAQDSFTLGSQAYADRHYEQAATNLAQAASLAPAPGTFHDLGNAEWQLGHTGPAILAWERALWLDPFAPRPHANLRFARKAHLLDSPDLLWYEICSTWLPANAWPWLASASLWLAIALIILPSALRLRRAGWHQALAAACFAVFLLTLPALLGIQSRSKLGVIIPANVNLRLTPTSEGQPTARLAPGEVVRLDHRRGKYLFVKTPTGSGWIEQSQLSLIAR